MSIQEFTLAMFLTSVATIWGCGRIGVELLSDDDNSGGSEYGNESNGVAIDAGSESDGAATIIGNIDVYMDATISRPDQDSGISLFEAGDVISNTNSATDASVEEIATDSAADTTVDSATDASADSAVDSATDASADSADDSATDASADSAVDSATDASADSADDSATDASADSAVDSATDAEIPDTAVTDSSDGAQVTDSEAEDTGSTTCGGNIVFGLCWYLTEMGDSCNQHCESHGGYDTDTPKYIGTESEGGSLDKCSQILTTLGHSQSVSEGTNIYGYGCHLWNGSDAWWLQSPEFDPTFSGAPARIACACIQ